MNPLSFIFNLFSIFRLLRAIRRNFAFCVVLGLLVLVLGLPRTITLAKSVVAGVTSYAAKQLQASAANTTAP